MIPRLAHGAQCRVRQSGVLSHREIELRSTCRRTTDLPFSDGKTHNWSGLLPASSRERASNDPPTISPSAPYNTRYNTSNKQYEAFCLLGQYKYSAPGVFAW